MLYAVVICASLGFAIALTLIFLLMRSDWARVELGRPADWHHTHAGSVPRLGGAALAVAFITVEMYIAKFHPDLRAATPGRDAIVIGALAMFALGFGDDLRPLPAGWKLLGQVVIAAAVCSGGVAIEVWKVPFISNPVTLGAWGPVLTVLWLVSLTNLVNLIDGLDGLAGGISLMLMLLIASVGHQNGNFELLASGMAGALIGFLRYNFPPARIYLGDGGAYFLGFQVGLYAIVNSHKGTVMAALVAPLFVLALPLTDACVTLARRGLRGLPLFRPDRKHLHHRLAAAGGSRRRVVLSLYAVNLAFLLLGLGAFWSRGEALPILLGAAVIILLGCAGSFRFSRRWFAVHRVVLGCLRMRRQVRSALCLARWLELEGRRCSGPQELWPNLVFAADKLGFASVTVTLPGDQRVWRRPDAVAGGATFRYDCAGGRFGRLDFLAPECSARPATGADSPKCDTRCRARLGNCLADPRASETVSELLAEAWNRSALRWSAQGPGPLVSCRAASTGAAAGPNSFIQFMKRMVTIWIMAALGLSLAGAEPPVLIDIGPALSRVPAAELPATAAELVRRAQASNRAEMATNVVRMAIRIHPAATPLVVSAVVRAAPEISALIARAAAAEQPTQDEEITRAAVRAAPAKAGEIVAAVCEVVPSAYRGVATAAARVSPQSTLAVLRGIGAARPDLKPYIERQIAASDRSKLSLGLCLDQAELARKSEQPGVSQGNPDDSGSGKPGSVNPEAAGPKPPHGNGHLPGGRNYARP